MRKIVMIGPVYPFKTGLSYYVGLLYRQLSKCNDVKLFSYTMQYPKFMYKKEQKDYSDDVVKIDEAEFLLNSANPFNWVKVAQRIKKEKPDLVLLQWLHPYFAPCYWFISKCIKKIPIMYICHNALPHERFPLDRFLTRITLSKAKYIIAHSNTDANILKEIVSKSIIAVNPHPAYNFFKIKNMSRDEGRSILKIDSSDYVLLFFGLIREYKGLKHLLNAVPIIKRKMPNVKVVIAGDFGSEDNKKEYDELITQLDISDNVIVHAGHLPIPEVEKFFVACDIVVLPYESATQSGVIQASYGFQKPVIATRVGGLPDAVIDGKTGYLIEPKSPEAIAVAVEDYFDNNRKEQMMACINEESYRFSWERMENTINSLLDN